jgi:hypothetical protein
MGLVSKLKDKLHHNSSNPSPPETNDSNAIKSSLPKQLAKVTDKLSHPGSGFSTPVSTDSTEGADGGGLAGAGDAGSKHAVKMEKKREEKEERRKDVERKEEKEKKRRGGDDSWAELVSPPSRAFRA